MLLNTTSLQCLKLAKPFTNRVLQGLLTCTLETVQVCTSYRRPHNHTSLKTWYRYPWWQLCSVLHSVNLAIAQDHMYIRNQHRIYWSLAPNIHIRYRLHPPNINYCLRRYCEDLHCLRASTSFLLHTAAEQHVVIAWIIKLHRFQLISYANAINHYSFDHQACHFRFSGI